MDYKLSAFAAAMVGLLLLLGAVAANAAGTKDTPSVKPPTQSCASGKRIQQMATKIYGEQLVAQGVSGDGNLLQLFLSFATHTFTVVKTTPGGVSCAVDVGTQMELILKFPGRRT